MTWYIFPMFNKSESKFQCNVSFSGNTMFSSSPLKFVQSLWRYGIIFLSEVGYDSLLHLGIPRSLSSSLKPWETGSIFPDHCSLVSDFPLQCISFSAFLDHKPNFPCSIRMFVDKFIVIFHKSSIDCYFFFTYNFQMFML